MPTDLSDEDALYGLAPDEFTAARNDLVKQLKKDGEKERAAVVAKLRKPTVTAWAVNQVARQSPALVDEVFEAGARLHAAMDAALQGDASDVRDAQTAEREAVDAAVGAALDALTGAGAAASEDARWRVAQTFRAALVDEDAATLVRAGTTVVDLESSGFGTFGFGDAASAPAKPKPAKAPAKKKAASKAASEAASKATSEAATEAVQVDELAVARAAKEEAKRQAAWQKADDRAVTLEAGAQQLVRAAADARAAADEAAAEVEERRAALAEAEAAATAATKAAADADRRAASATAAAEEARAAADELAGSDG